jgi:hypothetical protein
MGSHFSIIRIIPGRLSKCDVNRSKGYTREQGNVMNLKVALRMPLPSK